MDKFVAKNILNWLFKNLEDCENPKAFGKQLLGIYAGKWRYRVGVHRMICKIDHDKRNV
ncbi:TPA: type II toxin-antitoxin system RelE/ParE family toxin [Enterococcus faecium]|uniref:type II toxin-antitoxin system RelE family toxin n=1 Tax=Enterococcus TaxID=1350 RepID=UPI0021A89303|nr:MULTISPECIES: hypothetical protein [Enterococcus]EME3554482.1 hypothetical protein [Enterococcus faecium]MDU0320147.1 hypothetical protein [Enterococcus sp. 2STP]MDU0334549.1 hypothetical protein [Enterococcus sp. 2CBP]MDU0351704.1 hypothetical protein [Enterococcus sp. 3MOLP]